MIERLLGFAELLRKNGLRVSTGEVLDGTRAAVAVGLADPETLRSALLATLVKRQGDEATFHELYDLFFLRPGDLSGAYQDGPLAQALAAAGLDEDMIERLLAMVADESSRMGPVARMGLGLRRGHVEQLIRMSGTQIDLSRITSPLQIGFYTHRLLESMGFREAQDDLARAARRIAAQVGDAAGGALEQAVLANLRALQGAVRAHVQDELLRNNLDYTKAYRQQSLVEKPLAQMSPEELDRLREEVARLCQKLRTAVSLRPRRVKRGRLDVRRTLRHSLSTGGIPVRLYMRKRKLERPRLVIMLDVSDSVRHVARFMLQFVYTLQDMFSKVRSFIFVADLGETTDLFKRHPIERAVDLAYSGAVSNVYANSNFGRAFQTFSTRFLDAVTGKTTVLVIGDGRNNYNPSHASCLSDIRARAKRLLWLNPEPPLSWGFGDSAMRDYEPHTDKVVVAHNLASLQRVINELVL